MTPVLIVCTGEALSIPARRRCENLSAASVTFSEIQIPQYSSVRVSQSAEKQTPSLWRGGWRTSKEINIKQSASNERQFKVKFGGD